MPISNREAAELFLRKNKGYRLTDEEQRLLSEVKELDLSFHNINSLEGLSGLTNLQELKLFVMRIYSWEGLSGLTNLQTLIISHTTIPSLEWLSGLTNLQKIHISYLAVLSLEGLSGLTNLRSLEIHETPVNSLETLSGLTNLQTLSLRSTPVSSLKGLSGLTNLQTLNLNETQVSSLKGLSGLTNLQTLWLNDTKVSSLEGLETLTKLTRLGISETSLDRIPKWLIDQNLPFDTDRYWGNEPGVYMENVELSEQPVDLFSQSRELIEAYYQEKQVTVNEAKVIFLGDGGVGKTYTIYRIEHDGKAPGGTETTPGVSITQYLLAGNVTINIWDFGGQEIMRSMHRCFLTNRTCYTNRT